MNNVLVSVVVITYNSSKYVIETLESIKAQTYKNIELIITDDCSSDNTCEIVKKWVNDNEPKFQNTKLIYSEKNTGIPANCNRGLIVANGEWIKYIAGDDILLNNCIADNVSFSNNNKDAKFIFSLVKVFSKNKENNKDIIRRNNYFQNEAIKYFDLDVHEQKKELLIDNFCSAPTAMIHVETLKRLGMFDERILGMEDYPLWLKATSSGYKLYFNNVLTVKYRYGSSTAGVLYNKSIKKVFFLYKLKDLIMNNPKQAILEIYKYIILPITPMYFLKNAYRKIILK